MKHYYAVVHKDRDSAYGVSFPDLPGCFSAADTKEELLPNAIEALELWFEDQEEVAARDIEEVQADADVKAELAEGAFLLAVPHIVKTSKFARVNISMDKGMLDAIDTAAALRKMPRSAFIVEATRNEIEGRH